MLQTIWYPAWAYGQLGWKKDTLHLPHPPTSCGYVCVFVYVCVCVCVRVSIICIRDIHHGALHLSELLRGFLAQGSPSSKLASIYIFILATCACSHEFMAFHVKKNPKPNKNKCSNSDQKHVGQSLFNKFL